MSHFTNILRNSLAAIALGLSFGGTAEAQAIGPFNPNCDMLPMCECEPSFPVPIGAGAFCGCDFHHKVSSPWRGHQGKFRNTSLPTGKELDPCACQFPTDRLGTDIAGPLGSRPELLPPIKLARTYTVNERGEVTFID